MTASAMQEYRCILIGETGSGKSTVINYITNYFHGCRDVDELLLEPKRFKLAVPVKYWRKNVLEKFAGNISENNIDNVTISQTSKCSEYSFENIIAKRTYHFIDTPGFNDTNGTDNDQHNMNKIFDTCKTFSYINSIVLVMNGSDTRLTTSIKSVIENFNRLLPNQLSTNLIVILTNCDELSCNMNLNDFDIDCKCQYYMQNNFLKWNKKHSIDKASRKYECLKAEWQQSIQTIEKLLEEIVRHRPIATSLFQAIERQNQLLHNTICEQIASLTDLSMQIEKCSNQIATINYAANVMELNSKHENDFKISAIPLSGQNDEATLIDVQLYDNIAICHYYESQYDSLVANDNLTRLSRNIARLKSSMNELFVRLCQSVIEMRQNCSGFNFVDEFDMYLRELQSMAKNNDENADFCYKKILEILEYSDTESLMREFKLDAVEDEKMDVDDGILEAHQFLNISNESDRLTDLNLNLEPSNLKPIRNREFYCKFKNKHRCYCLIV